MAATEPLTPEWRLCDRILSDICVHIRREDDDWLRYSARTRFRKVMAQELHAARERESADGSKLSRRYIVTCAVLGSYHGRSHQRPDITVANFYDGAVYCIPIHHGRGGEMNHDMVLGHYSCRRVSIGC